MITRFAPSPTGLLHLGHAYSALVAWDLARTAGGQFLLRIEDIDQPRCRPEFEAAIFHDLRALGLAWPEPVLRQSARLPAYEAALEQLGALGVTYPCGCSRGDIRAALSAPQEGAAGRPDRPDGPDGPIYPGTCRARPLADRRPGDAIRLNMARAVALTGDIAFDETGTAPGRYIKTPAEMIETIGDIVLARRDIGTSYHLAVVVDDAHQGITDVVRGRDLFAATPVHVVLQRLLGLPVPAYHHHRLIRDENGRRLAKRDNARALARLFDEGLDASAIRARLGLPPAA